MRGLAAEPEANRAKIEALIDRAARLRAEREKAAFRHRADRDKIFTPEQREKMKAFRESLANRRGIAGRRALGIGRPGFRGPGRLMGSGVRERRTRPGEDFARPPGTPLARAGKPCHHGLIGDTPPWSVSPFSYLRAVDVLETGRQHPFSLGNRLAR
ncbi:MAG: hypothetical protein M0C28_15560 [Candidatus Moduliflexus flocculans]|nr:hypothetical protein [Candidatus Moduliflexus flocculans]